MSREVMKITLIVILAAAGTAGARDAGFEVSKDGRELAFVSKPLVAESYVVRGSGVPYGTVPDWQNDFRIQVGGLQVVDVNGDGLNDLVVGCYRSQSYPPYDDWHNFIYFNTGIELEATPSWVSADQVSTTDVQVGDVNGDGYIDIFAANGDFSMSPSVIYFGGPGGPSTSPGWVSGDVTWTIGSALFDINHNGYLDLVTANQGNSPNDPHRPMYVFYNTNGALSTTPGWQSAEWSIQNCVSLADYDGDGWEDVAVSKWVNFSSGVYRNMGGTLQDSPVWTVGNTESEKGIVWADFTGNGYPDLAVGHKPTRIYYNEGGTLTLGWEAELGPHYGHSEIAAVDVDGDGDLDLVEIHFSNGHVRIYMNDGGVFDTSASWQYDSPHVGTALAFGDINGNGRLDLVVGNSGQNSVMVFYAQAPQCPEDLNGDGVIDQLDLSILLASYGIDGGGDINGDGLTDQLDLAALLALYGQPCP